MCTFIGVIKSEKVRWGKHAACIWKMKIAYTTSVGKLERMRRLERSRHTGEDNIKLILNK
jgi:hypothetical protein